METFKGKLITLAIIATFSSLAQAETLNEVVKKSIQNHPKILGAVQNRLSIDEAITQARGNYFPQVKANASYGPQWSRNSNTLANVQAGGNASSVTMPVRMVGISVDQMVFDGFATPGEVKRHTARANAAAYQISATVQDTAMDAIQAYIDVLRERALVQVARRNYNELSGIAGSISQRARQGVSNNADAIQANGQIALARTNLTGEINNLMDAEARYRMAVGEAPPAHLPLPGRIPGFAMPKSEQDAIAYALKHNPTLKSAEADIQQTFQQREVAKAKNYPRLDLQAGVNRNRNVGGVRGPDFDQFIYAKVSYDIFAGGSIVGRQRETEHQLQQAHEIRDNTYRQVIQATKLSWNGMVTSRRIMPYLMKHRSATGNTVTAYLDQFNLSKRNLIDVLNVQGERYAASRALVDGRYKMILSQYQVLHNMGNLVQTLNVLQPQEVNVYKLD